MTLALVGRGPYGDTGSATERVRAASTWTGKKLASQSMSHVAGLSLTSGGNVVRNGGMPRPRRRQQFFTAAEDYAIVVFMGI